MMIDAHHHLWKYSAGEYGWISPQMNVIRRDFDRLKAILTNCVRHGPESQNREGHPQFQWHLEGRVSFVEMINSAKGVRLRKIFEQIQWQ